MKKECKTPFQMNTENYLHSRGKRNNACAWSKRNNICSDTNLSDPRCDSIPITWHLRDWGTTAFRALSKMDIITSYHYIHTRGIHQYIQVTWIQQHQNKASDYRCKHEKNNDIHLLSQAADPEPNPRLKKKKKKKKKKKDSNTTIIALTSRQWKPAPATVVVVSVRHEDSAIP